jgi:hypothetical protein
MCTALVNAVWLKQICVFRPDPKTQRICVPLNPDNVFEFDPNDVPSLEDILRDMETNGSKDTKDKDRYPTLHTPQCMSRDLLMSVDFVAQSVGVLVCFPKASYARCLLTLRFLHTHTMHTHSLTNTYSKKRAHASPQLDRYVKTFKNSFLNPMLKEQSRLMREVATF